MQKVCSAEKLQVKESIYVCIICQLFSTSASTVAAHITSDHVSSLPLGARTEDFVSVLRALQTDKDDRKGKNKGGRPRKKESSVIDEEKTLILEPVLGPDGLYCCQKCHRRFKKIRQLSSHVCLEIPAENDFSCESALDSDSTSDFQTYMDIEPTPWLRRPKHNNKSNKGNSINSAELQSDEPLCESDLLKPEDRSDNMKTYWRDDPNYVQLFENDADRYAFEKHLKSIDYSCVNSLFVQVENRTKRFKKRKRPNVASYSCIICRKEFHSLFHIRMHCLTHTDVKPFTCPKCPYRSNTKGSLYTHMRNHTGKLFRCSKCAFKTIKRSHLLEHEQTHSSVIQLCKLCKNTYKTVKSLIAHVHRYHNNPGGKKYIKFLSGKSSKDSFIKCNICQRKFKTQFSFSTHTHTSLPVPAILEGLNENIQHTTNSEINQNLLPSTPGSNIECTSETQTIEDPLDEIVLNDLLQPKSEIYQNMFAQCSNPHTQTETEDLSNAFAMESSPPQRLSQLVANNRFEKSSPVLEECEKTLSIDLINECLRDSGFANQVMAETCGQSSKLPNDSESFGLHEIQMVYPNGPLISSNITENGNLSKNLSHLDSELHDKNDSTDFASAEPKSAETKLFEKCRQTAAFVCCVCSAIYVCSATLKIHLKEHINTNNSLIEQDNEDMENVKISEADATIDSVCEMLEDSDIERELEKLYMSSLDLMYYLPEVSVLLENDSKFVDAVLDDISDFPEKYNETGFPSEI